MKVIKKKYFTLVEMLVVIAIIGILAGILLPVFASARARGHETSCANNLKQLMVSVVAYRQDYGDKKLPRWLSGLYGDYLKTSDVYRCSADGNDKGTAPESWKARNDDHWQEIYDRKGNEGYDYGSTQYFPNTAVGNVSYFYEFPDVKCDWWHSNKSFIPSMNPSSVGTWFQVKMEQLRKGQKETVGGVDIIKKFSPDKFPVIRCFWHVDDVEDYDVDLPNSSRDYSTGGIPNNAEKVINASFNGNIFYSTATWENKTWTP
jgi:prepilin-type N-terminal cleavage/methylation domain-containing protein